MSATSLSRFVQSPLNAAIFSWYPPLVLRCYVRTLGRVYFNRKPREWERYLRSLQVIPGMARRAAGSPRELERRVLHGICDHYFEKMLMAYWGLPKVRRFLLNQTRIVGPDLLTGALGRGRIFITELDEMKAWKPTADKVMSFFGRRVQLDRAVELLHRRTGAPVLLGLMERVGRQRYQLVLEEPQEHHAAPTGLGPDAQLLKRLEHYIYDSPDHWYIWDELHHLDRHQAA